MRRKLEITRRLEQMSHEPQPRRFRRQAGPTVAILNLPAPHHCSKGCAGCMMEEKSGIRKEREDMLPAWQLMGHATALMERFGTRFITINGRGDPFHPRVKLDTLGKLSYAYTRGIRSYVFTAGDNLDEQTCRMLANHKANVMMSLMGNPFIDAGFFEGRRHYEGKDRVTAENFWRLINAFRNSYWQPEGGLTRLGMNYVVTPEDIREPGKLERLRRAANRNGIFFICNTGFHPDAEQSADLRAFALEHSDFNLAHSTTVDGVCQMGAGSSLTIAANGDIYRCPYMLEGSDGNIMGMSMERLAQITAGHQADRRYACVLRKTDRGKITEN